MIDTKIQDTPSVLPQTLRRCGYKLQQVHRSQYAAIYSVTDIETQQAHGFEVFYGYNRLKRCPMAFTLVTRNVTPTMKPLEIGRLHREAVTEPLKSSHNLN